MGIEIVIPNTAEDADEQRFDDIESAIVSETLAREVGDALAVQRANHEGTQPIDTVTGLEEALSEAAGPKSYRHNQGPPSAVWDSIHNLGFYPAGIDVIGSDGARHRPERIEHISVNRTKLYFRFAFGGTADFS